MRIGIFGGSFDPPHVGHLLMAQDMVEALALDHLLIIPAAHQPLKPGAGASPLARLELVRRTFAQVPSLEVDPVEITRGGLSYMVDTVGDIRRRWPEAELMLVIGSDVVQTLPRWRQIGALVEMVQLVVLERSSAYEHGSDVVDVGGGVAVPVRRMATRRLDVSSTEIRARIRDGRSIRGFVTDAVAEYIESNRLYHEESEQDGRGHRH